MYWTSGWRILGQVAGVYYNLSLHTTYRIIYFNLDRQFRNIPQATGVNSVPDSKSRNIPEVVLVWRWAVKVLGIWRGWDSWVKGGANGVSLQAT